MASVYVYQCSGGRSQTTPVMGVVSPSCANGSGAWIEVEANQPAPFDWNTLDKTELAAVWAAGFVVVATGMVIAIPMRLLINAIRSM